MLDDASCLFTAGQDRLSRSDRAGTTSRGCSTKGVGCDLLLVAAGSRQDRSAAVRSRSTVSGEQRFTRFDMPSSSARHPRPRKAHWGSLRRGGVRRGLERRHQGEYTNVLPSNVRAPDISPQCPVGEVTENSRWGQRRVAVCPLSGVRLACGDAGKGQHLPGLPPNWHSPSCRLRVRPASRVTMYPRRGPVSVKGG